MSPKYTVNSFVYTKNAPQFSRSILLSWFNTTLRSNIARIEDLSTGIAYCCLIDLLFPGSLSMRKVKFDPMTESDFLKNYFTLRNTFLALKINKVIPMEKLVRGKFQDNFEFACWFHYFFMANCMNIPPNIDPLARRNHERIGQPRKPRSKSVETKEKSKMPASRSQSQGATPTARTRPGGAIVDTVKKLRCQWHNQRIPFPNNLTDVGEPSESSLDDLERRLAGGCKTASGNQKQKCRKHR